MFLKYKQISYRRLKVLISQYIVTIQTPNSHLLPKHLLSGKRQRKIDAIQCHPIDLPLPSWPVPPHGGITGGTHVLIVPEPINKHSDNSIYHNSFFFPQICAVCHLLYLALNITLRFVFDRINNVIFTLRGIQCPPPSLRVTQ